MSIKLSLTEIKKKSVSTVFFNILFHKNFINSNSDKGQEITLLLNDIKFKCNYIVIYPTADERKHKRVNTVLQNDKTSNRFKLALNNNITPNNKELLRKIIMTDTNLSDTDFLFQGSINNNTTRVITKLSDISIPELPTRTNTEQSEITKVLSESLFCYYLAMKLTNNINKYDLTQWLDISTKSDLVKWTTDIGINYYCEYQNNDRSFTSRLNHVYWFLTNDNWHEKILKQVDEFINFTKIPLSTYYSIIRSDIIPSSINLQDLYIELSEKVRVEYNFSQRVKKDKWNPADVWVISSNGQHLIERRLASLRNVNNESAAYSAGILASLNKFIYSLYKMKHLYPISLKAPNSEHAVKIDIENVDRSDTHKDIRFVKVELGENNLDVKLHFVIDVINKRTNKLMKSKTGFLRSKTASGDFRLEIEMTENKKARFGSIGKENYQWIISNTDDSGVKELENIRKNHKEVDNSVKNNNNVWLGSMKNYQNDLSMETLEPYFQEIYDKINRTNDSNFHIGNMNRLINKTIASEIAVAIEFIKNKIKRDITIENLYDLAASHRLSGGIRPDQLKRKTKIHGEEIQFLGPMESQFVFNSAFYIKIY